jgi:ribosomal protein S18 acetylase RimI-like enzyme
MDLMNIEISIASENDLDEILALQKIAYISEAKLHNDYSIKPLKQTIEEIHKDFKKGIILKVSNKESKKIIASVRAYENKNKDNYIDGYNNKNSNSDNNNSNNNFNNNATYIEKLMVHPDYQNKGLGKMLVEAIEEYCPNNSYELFTSHKSSKNLYLYKKCGYKEFKKEKVSDDFYFIHLRKTLINNLN